MATEPNPQVLSSFIERVESVGTAIMESRAEAAIIPNASPLFLGELGSLLDTNVGGEESLSVQLFPLARGFFARFPRFPRSILIGNQRLTVESLAQLKSARLNVEFIGWTEQDALATLPQLMMKDIRRLRVLVWALPLALATLLATWPGMGVRDADPPAQVIGGMIASVAAIFLAVFSFYSGYAHEATNRSPELLGQHFNEDRLLLTWTLLSLAGAFLGSVLFFSGLPASLAESSEFWSWVLGWVNSIIQYLAALSITLSAVFIVPPLVDVVNFLLARQLNLSSFAIARESVPKAAPESPEDERLNS